MWLPDLKNSQAVAVELTFQRIAQSSAANTAAGRTRELFFSYRRASIDHFCVFDFSRKMVRYQLKVPGGEKITRKEGDQLLSTLPENGVCRFLARFAFPLTNYTTPLVPSASMFQTRFRKENEDFDFLPVGIRYRSSDGAADLIVDRSAGDRIQIQFTVPIEFKHYDDLHNVWMLATKFSELIVIEKKDDNVASKTTKKPAYEAV